MSGNGKNVRWSLCRFQCRPSVFHNRPSSAEDTSSGGRSVNASGSLLAHFLRAKPPVCISSVSLWTSCRASLTPSQIVARSSTYMSDSTLSVSASEKQRTSLLGEKPPWGGQNGKGVGGEKTAPGRKKSGESRPGPDKILWVLLGRKRHRGGKKACKVVGEKPSRAGQNGREIVEEKSETGRKKRVQSCWKENRFGPDKILWVLLGRKRHRGGKKACKVVGDKPPRAGQNGGGGPRRVVTSVLGRDSCSRMSRSIPQNRRTPPGTPSYLDCLGRLHDGAGTMFFLADLVFHPLLLPIHS
ncbi:hypothetical protein T10_13712 [Trichinella papuae]|uniref:Uncharacterized protein n=1 Tax=Trichinella papuae TaxID=268474 RepID=A0A0V1M2W8_9BILA|nr:hypothetical protein T10_13712 [Trichinella papuae]